MIGHHAQAGGVRVRAAVRHEEVLRHAGRAGERAMGRDLLGGTSSSSWGGDRKRAKALFLDGTGLCLYAKRLEKGRFAALWQRAQDGQPVPLTLSELALFFEGASWWGEALSPAPSTLGRVFARRGGGTAESALATSGGCGTGTTRMAAAGDGEGRREAAPGGAAAGGGESPAGWRASVELTRELMTPQGEDASALQLRLAELERQLAQRAAELFGPPARSARAPTPRPPAGEAKPPRGHGPRASRRCPWWRWCTPGGGGQAVPPVRRRPGGDEGLLRGGRGSGRGGAPLRPQAHRRQKYRCGCGACVETAPGPPKLRPGGRYSLDFAIEVAVPEVPRPHTRWSGRCASWRARAWWWTARRSGTRVTRWRACC